MRYQIVFIVAIMLSSFQYLITAAPIQNEPCEFRQPDGSLIPVIVSGDEFYQNVETPDGYSLIRDPLTEWICYAKLSADSDELVSTGIVYNAHKGLQKSAILKNVDKHLRIDTKSLLEIKKEKFLALNKRTVESETQSFKKLSLSKQNAATVDTVYGVTILIDFPDQKSAIPYDSIANFLNQTNYKGYGNNGSVKDYFSDISAGKLVYIQKIVPFVTAKNNKSYYDRTDGSGYAGSDELVKEILTTIKNNNLFNFSTVSLSNRAVRAVNFFYAGSASAGWAQGLWPHSGWTNFSINGVYIQKHMMDDLGKSLGLGSFCHENGHMLCNWVDLYAYDDHSAGAGGYDLMSTAGNLNPVPPNAFLRSLLGWMKIVEISKDLVTATFKIPANSDMAYFYSGTSTGSSSELYCIEACRKTGRSKTMPDEGLMVWHIDKNGSNTEAGKNDYAVPEQADGKFDLENKRNYGAVGDLYKAGYVTRFNDSTLPSAKWHTGSLSKFRIISVSPVGDTMTFSIRDNYVTTIDKNNSGSQIVSFSVHNNQLCYSLSGNDVASVVELKVFGLNGQLIKTIVRDNQFANKSYTIGVDQLKNSQGKGISAGKYYCKLLSGKNSALIPLMIY